MSRGAGAGMEARSGLSGINEDPDVPTSPFRAGRSAVQVAQQGSLCALGGRRGPRRSATLGQQVVPEAGDDGPAPV